MNSDPADSKDENDGALPESIPDELATTPPDEFDTIDPIDSESSTGSMPPLSSLDMQGIDSTQSHPDKLLTSNPPVKIGRYNILEMIAEGGMGAVYKAEQLEPIHRIVALKLIKAGRNSEQIIARFEAERQALAMMEHPNIAKILDAGTSDDGSPFFVMELVNGIPLTQYCDENKLSIRQRLDLFVPVCQAVQHAHQKGIVHRDLKPSNVLVGTYDGVAIPKVIDFGLAKATEHQTKLTDKTMHTEFGAIVGTLQYMSPEQAGSDHLDIDTRTDIYSLGVMLYELLTGSTPLDRATMGKQALLKILEVIREQEPPRPSTRLSDSSDTITGVSDQRKIQPAKLQQILKGELDWVVMKSLEKDRTRRYETATAFADDIRRFLNHEAVLARPPSPGYLLKKLVRKNRGSVSAVAALFALLVAAVAVSSLFAVEANKARINEAEQRTIAEKKSKEVAAERDRANEKEALATQEASDQAAISEFMLDVFGAGDPMFGSIVSAYGVGLGQTTTVGVLVDQATERAMNDEGSLEEKPLIRARMLDRLGDVQMGLGKTRIARKLHDRASELLKDAGQIDGLDLAKNLTALATLDYLFGDLKIGRQRLERSLEIRRREIMTLPNSKVEFRDLQQSRLMLGIVFSEYQDFEHADRNYKLVIQSDPNAAPESPFQIAFSRMLLAMTKILSLASRRRV